jgi:hypothetical protein
MLPGVSPPPRFSGVTSYASLRAIRARLSRPHKVQRADD